MKGRVRSGRDVRDAAWRCDHHPLGTLITATWHSGWWAGLYCCSRGRSSPASPASSPLGPRVRRTLRERAVRRPPRRRRARTVADRIRRGSRAAGPSSAAACALRLERTINFDLPQALLAVVSPADFDNPSVLRSRRADHGHVDAVLRARVGAEDDELNAVSTNSLIDRLLRSANRAATRRFLAEARAQVWRNAVNGNGEPMTAVATGLEMKDLTIGRPQREPVDDGC